MSGRVGILPTAWEDLKKIEDCYMQQHGAEAATGLSDGILDALEELEKSQQHGAFTPDAWLNGQGYRMVRCGDKYIAIYRTVHGVTYVYHIADTETKYVKLYS